ncbi:MAG: DUF3300 domain-containing protein [Betaproteobacteria bacterium]|nr:DUF3300 domain-containing protein [Betaproteobacteria bacterium]
MKALVKYAATRLLVLALVFTPGLAPVIALAQDQPAFSQQQLDQLLAPVALYPDPLLSQMLMAATYPLEVAEAARWSRMHPELQGDDAVRAAAEEDWDPSVKSLVAFPQVLAWMDDNPEWTRTVGDAFLAQEPQVMETLQMLRYRAHNAGSLRSDERIQVVQDARAISVLPVHPQIVYVPYYDPSRAFGAWWWAGPAPTYWRPWPGYFIPPGHAARFYWGPGIVVSRGFFFGACDWPRRRVQVVNVNNTYYRTRAAIASPRANVAAQANVSALNQAPRAWQHDPAHRRGIAYREAAAQRFSGIPGRQRAQARNDERPRSGPRPEIRPAGPPVQAVAPNAVSPGPRAAHSQAQNRAATPATPAIVPNVPQAPRAAESRPEIRPAGPPVQAVVPNAVSTGPRAAHSQAQNRAATPPTPAIVPNVPQAPRAAGFRPEIRPAAPPVQAAVPSAVSPAPRAAHFQAQDRAATPPTPAIVRNVPQAPRAAEFRPEIRPAPPPMRATVPDLVESPRARHGRAETRPPEMRREAAIRADAPAIPGMQVRAGGGTPAPAGAPRTGAHERGGGEKGQTSHQGRRSDSRERWHRGQR